MNARLGCDAPGHQISDHEGILDVRALAGREAVEVTFDGSRLSEQELRRILGEHLQSVPQGPRRRVLHLDGRACEAAADRLSRRIEEIPGIRRATATYVGQVLCLTFSDSPPDEPRILEEVQQAGASVRPLISADKDSSFWDKIRAGQLNEELSCAAGFLALVAAAIGDHTPAQGMRS